MLTFFLAQISATFSLEPIGKDYSKDFVELDKEEDSSPTIQIVSGMNDNDDVELIGKFL